MASRIVRTPLAEADIEDIAECLRQEAGLAVALRFVTSTEAAFRALAHNPRIGSVVALSGLIERDIRRWHIKGFDRLVILYRPEDQGIEIVRVLHGARNLASLFQDDPL